MPITADDVLNGAAPSKPAAASSRPITAQDVLDYVPRAPANQPQLVKDGQNFDVNSLDSPSFTPNDVQGLRVEQRPTGADTNVLPGNAGFTANLKAGMVEDPKTKAAFYAKALFPDDPTAINRFGMRDGKVMYIDNEGTIRDVEHGAGSRVGAALAYAPETAGSIVGTFATGNPVAGGALGAMAGKGLKQIFAGTALDDPQTMSGNLKGMAGEGLINAAGGLLAKGGSKFFNKGRVVDFTPAQTAGAVKMAQEIEKRLGIKLDLSQASQDPILMSLRKYAAKFPGQSSQIFKDLDAAQTGQAADAMQGLLDKVAKATASEAAGSKGINAAAKAIKDARSSVSAEVKPLYDAAYAAVPEVTDPKILGMLKNGYFQSAYKAGQKIAELEDKAAGVTKKVTTTSSREQVRPGLYKTVTNESTESIPKPDLRSLDYTKRSLDDKIETLRGSGKRQEARALKMKRDEFVAALDALPNKEWQAARRRYGELAKEQIEPLENGAIGVLANTENRKAATVAAKMFTDPNITANEIRFARGAIEKADPEAWNQLTRQYLASTLNKALKVTQKGESTNLAGKLYQSMAGTPETLAKLNAALPTSAQAHAKDVLDAFKLIASTERIGSDTAFNQLVTKKIEGRFSTTLKMMRSPVQTIIEQGEQNSLDKLVLRLAEGLTDPAKIAQLKQVTKASPSLNRALQIASIMGVAPAGRVAEGEINPSPDMPIPALEPRRGAGRQPPMREIP